MNLSDLIAVAAIAIVFLLFAGTVLGFISWKD